MLISCVTGESEAYLMGAGELDGVLEGEDPPEKKPWFPTGEGGVLAGGLQGGLVLPPPPP